MSVWHLHHLVSVCIYSGGGCKSLWKESDSQWSSPLTYDSNRESSCWEYSVRFFASSFDSVRKCCCELASVNQFYKHFLKVLRTQSNNAGLRHLGNKLSYIWKCNQSGQQRKRFLFIPDIVTISNFSADYASDPHLSIAVTGVSLTDSL